MIIVKHTLEIRPHPGVDAIVGHVCREPLYPILILKQGNHIIHISLNDLAQLSADLLYLGGLE